MMRLALAVVVLVAIAVYRRLPMAPLADPDDVDWLAEYRPVWRVSGASVQRTWTH